jgi:hypothetical protein
LISENDNTNLALGLQEVSTCLGGVDTCSLLGTKLEMSLGLRVQTRVYAWRRLQG